MTYFVGMEEEEEEEEENEVCFVIGMAKVLPIIDVLGYDGQNSSFSSSPPPPPYSDSTPIAQKGSHIST